MLGDSNGHDIFHPPPSRWWLPIWSIYRWMRWRYYQAPAAATTTRPRSRRREKFRWLEVRCQPATVSSLRMEAAKWVEAATTQNSYYGGWQTVTWLYRCSQESRISLGWSLTSSKKLTKRFFCKKGSQVLKNKKICCINKCISSQATTSCPKHKKLQLMLSDLTSFSVSFKKAFMSF